jgi:hypothetical protein
MDYIRDRSVDPQAEELIALFINYTPTGMRRTFAAAFVTLDANLTTQVETYLFCTRLASSTNRPPPLPASMITVMWS